MMQKPSSRIDKVFSFFVVVELKRCPDLIARTSLIKIIYEVIV
jgi:hypothetical protein